MRDVKKVLLIFLCMVPAIGFSQVKKPKHDSTYDKKTLHFGFTLGLNAMDFILYPSRSALMPDSLFPNVTALRPGFNINIVSSLKMGKHFNLRFLPGISFGQRDIYYYKTDSTGGISRSTDRSQKIESSFLEFPLVVKYRSERVNNFRPYLLGGINYRMDLSAKKEYNPDKNVWVRLKQNDLYFETGFGIDFFLKYFKFSPEIKLSVGTRDLLVHQPAPGHGAYVTALDRLKSKIWILSFHFE